MAGLVFAVSSYTKADETEDRTMAQIDEKALVGEQKRAESWQKKFSEFDRNHAIADAAVRHGAKNVGQIRDLIGHKVVLAEQPGGAFVSVIKSGEKTMTVDEYVAALAKTPEHANLFHGKRETSQTTVETDTRARDSESLPRKIGRALKSLTPTRKRDAVAAGSPADSLATKIGRGLRALR